MSRPETSGSARHPHNTKGAWLALANPITTPGNGARARIRLTITNPVLPSKTRRGIASFDDLWAGGTYWATNMWVVKETTVDMRLVSGTAPRTGHLRGHRLALCTVLARGA